ncbi:MAG: hypothetical protein P4M15_09930 [Alphaproteobacteria bacterium]|nr:hypothetical protein [Alphaproteobacteria bacterium]
MSHTGLSQSPSRLVARPVFARAIAVPAPQKRGILLNLIRNILAIEARQARRICRARRRLPRVNITVTLNGSMQYAVRTPNELTL